MKEHFNGALSLQPSSKEICENISQSIIELKIRKTKSKKSEVEKIPEYDWLLIKDIPGAYIIAGHYSLAWI